MKSRTKRQIKQYIYYIICFYPVVILIELLRQIYLGNRHIEISEILHTSAYYYFGIIIYMIFYSFMLDKFDSIKTNQNG